MILRAGPFYKDRPNTGEIWRKGMLHFEIKGFHLFDNKELVLVECVGSALKLNMIGRRTFESVFVFKKDYWKKILSKPTRGVVVNAYC